VDIKYARRYKKTIVGSILNKYRNIFVFWSAGLGRFLFEIIDNSVLMMLQGWLRLSGLAC